jgi:DNA-binding MarR family transcriptional regulator
MNASPPALPCLCATLRRASRALTQRYEEALRPLDLTSSQFTILQALSFTGEVTQNRLGKILAMDPTTLTRTLAIMRRHGWLSSGQGADRRERQLRLSKAGEAELARATPGWEKAQAAVRVCLGDRRWHNLMQLANQVTSMVAE